MHPPVLDNDGRANLFERCLERVKDAEFPGEWILSSDIKRDNVVEWMSWALFSSEVGNLQSEWEEELEAMLRRVELETRTSFEPGYNPKAKSMRLTFDPVVMVHRPLSWYIVSESRFSRQLQVAWRWLISIEDRWRGRRMVLSILGILRVSSLCSAQVVPDISFPPSHRLLKSIRRS